MILSSPPTGWLRSEEDPKLITRSMKDFEVLFSGLTASEKVPKFPITGSILLELGNAVETQDLIDRTTKAWKRLTLECPLFKIQCVSDFSYSFKAETSQVSMTQWAKQTFAFHQSQSGPPLTMENVLDINNALSHQDLPDVHGNWSQLRLVAAKDNTTRFALILRLSHNLVDAGSVTLSLNGLLRHIANDAVEADWDDLDICHQQISRLPVALSDMMPKPNEEDKMDKEAIMTAYKRSTKQFPPRSVVESKLKPGSKAIHKAIRLDEVQSERLYRYAKKHDVTVGALLHASIVFRCAIEEGLESFQGGALYTSEIPIDPRSVLPSKNLIGLYAVAMPVEMPLTEGLDLWKQPGGTLSAAVIHMAQYAMQNIYGPVRSAAYRHKLAVNNALLSECLTEASQKGFFNFNVHLCEVFSDSILDGSRYLDPTQWSTYDDKPMIMLDYDMSAQIANGSGLLFRAWNVNNRTYIGIDWSTAFHDTIMPYDLLCKVQRDVISLLEDGSPE